jgi:spermidine/putrescine transport system substrate-binding protein
MSDQKRKKSDILGTNGATMTRRNVLKTGAAATAAVTSFSIFSKSYAADQSLRVLCWPGYEERGVVEEFEDTHKVKVDFKIYIGGEQMLSYFSQTPRGTFDAIISDSEYIGKLRALNALEPFSTAGMPDIDNYHPKLRDVKMLRADDGKVWSVVTRFSFYGISYNTNVISHEEAQDWNILFDPKLKGRIGVFDWYLPNMGNVSMAVQPNIEDPYAISDEALEQVRQWLLKLRPQVLMFAAANQPLVQAMLAEDIYASPVGDFEIDLILAGHKNYSSTIPKQGGVRFQETAALCAQGRNKELAMEWIKYMMRAKTQSQLVYTNAFKARAPNMKVVDFWNDQQRELLSYVPDPNNPNQLLVETLLERSVPRSLPSLQPERKWIDIYNEFKSAS